MKAILALVALGLALPAHAGSARLQLAAAAGAPAAEVPAVDNGRVYRTLPVPSRQSGDGREEAGRLCGGLSEDALKLSCLRAVGKGNWFDLAALRVCRDVSPDENAAACVGAIVDKTYLSAELGVCRDAYGDEAIVSCLRDTGRPFAQGPEGNSYLLGGLRRVREHLLRGDVRRALYELDALIRLLEGSPL